MPFVRLWNRQVALRSTPWLKIFNQNQHFPHVTKILQKRQEGSRTSQSPFCSIRPHSTSCPPHSLAHSLVTSEAQRNQVVAQDPEAGQCQDAAPLDSRVLAYLYCLQPAHIAATPHAATHLEHTGMHRHTHRTQSWSHT